MGHLVPIPRFAPLSIAAFLVSVAAADDLVITFPAPPPTDASESSCPQCFTSVRVLQDSGRSFTRIQDSVVNLSTDSSSVDPAESTPTARRG